MAKANYGTGTVFQHGDKWRWQGSYIDEQGKKHRPSKLFNTKEEALAFQATQTAQSEIKKVIKSQDLTAGEVFLMWCQAFRDGELKGKLKISESTRKNSIRNWNTHLLPLIGQDNLKTLSTIKIERYFNKLQKENKSLRTIYNIYADLLKIIKFAISKGIIYNNPIADISFEKPKQNKKVVNVMPFDDYKKLVECEKNKESYYYYAIIFLAETGLRAEELAIKKTDVYTTENGLMYIVINKSVLRALKDDDKSSHIIISDNVKNDISERKVPLNLFAQNAIENQLEYCRNNNIYSPFVFCTKTGGLLEQRNLLRALHMMCENAGIPKRGLHSLRKLYVNHALKNGITPFDLAKITGHSMQTMFNYYHDLDEELLKAVADASENRK